MIVGYGDNNVLLIGLVKTQLEDLEKNLTLTYDPPAGITHMHGPIIIIYADTKPQLLEQLKRAGVAITEQTTADYLAGKRTDKPRRPF